MNAQTIIQTDAISLLTPWYLHNDAKRLIDAACYPAPNRVHHEKHYALTTERWSEYDRSDARVAAIESFMKGWLTLALTIGDALGRTGEAMRAAGFGMDVEAVIDAALDARELAA